MKQLIISRDALETRVAVLEDGKPAEMYLERPQRRSLVGNVYKGRVENILPGMDAAFVDIGLDRNGFLAVAEVVSEARGGRPRRIADVLKPGKELLVQVTRDPMGGKGPRLTMEVGIPGRYVVYFPGGGGCGVSRRLCDSERERLRAVGRDLRPEKGGVIVRTAAEGAGPEALERDLRFLQRMWAGVERRATTALAPSLVYAEAELAVRTVRDLLSADFSAAIVDDEKLHRRLVSYLRAIAPDYKDLVQRHTGDTALFERFGLGHEIDKALSRRVGLPSGGHIVIDHTEAMTVIDVNTGRFVGKKQLEDTTLKTNLEACKEVVRQLRLRDIGGIIVIDFIDMTAKNNRDVVLAALEAEFTLDRTKTYVVAISPLGLVEMTRQNATQGLREIVTTTCPMCKGHGRVISDETALIAVERALAGLLRASDLPVVRVEVSPRMAGYLAPGGEVARRLLEQTGRRVEVQVAPEGVALAHVAVVPD